MNMKIGFLVVFACVVIAVGADDTPPASVPEKVCEPGKEFTKDCNLCKCNEDGTQVACDTKSCPEVQPSAEEKCTPGELYKNKCNQCKCPESGLKSEASCTVIGCPDE